MDFGGEGKEEFKDDSYVWGTTTISSPVVPKKTPKNPKSNTCFPTWFLIHYHKVGLKDMYHP